MALPSPRESPAARIPPHNLDAEEGLLGCILLDGGGDVLVACLETGVEPDYFYKPSHRIFFSGMRDLYEVGKPVDEIVLADHLQKKREEAFGQAGGTVSLLERAGGYAELERLTSRIETTAHATYWREIVREKYFLRELIKTSSSVVDQAYDQSGDLDTFLDEVEKRIFSISQARIQESAKPMNETVDAATRIIQFYVQREGKLSGVATGFKDLDDMTFGLQRQEMIVLAARPSMGKTSLAMNIAEAAVLPRGDQPGTATLVFSLEMSAEQLGLRMLCCRAGVNMKRVKDGMLGAENERKLAQAAKEFQKAPLWIEDSGYLRILELRAKARRMHSRHPLGLVVIDYLQLVNGMDSRVPREQQISEISRGVKALAKELNVPVLVLSQLNRASDKERREPRLSDLRESGAIEQDADVVLLLAPKTEGEDGEGSIPQAARQRNLIVAKNRNGPVGTVPLTFLPEFTRFESFAKEEVL